MSTPTHSPFRLAGWLVQPELNRVTGPAGAVQVEPRIMHVLVVLVRHAGAVVSREALIDEVWSDTIVGEETLTRAISELRRIFGDDSRTPCVIETIRKGGYRLIAPVTTAEAPQPRLVPPPTAMPRPRARRSPLPLVLLGAAAVALAVLALQLDRRQAASLLQPAPFTTYAGRETMPALSPDGTAVAFAWLGPNGDNADVYLKQQGTETPLRLTDHPGREGLPAWSPDGSTIAFVREDGDRFLLLAVAAIGGPARTLASFAGRVRGLDFHPDGTALVIAAESGPGAPSRLHRLDLSTLQTTALTSPAEQSEGDSAPAWSPDGRTLAFARGDRARLDDIWLLDDGRGEPRRLTRGLLQVQGIDWCGRSEIVFSAFTGGTYGLWRLDVGSGAKTWVPVMGERLVGPSVSIAAARLVYERLSWEKDVWRISRSGPRGPADETAPLIASTRWDCEASFAADGRRLAFTSNRTGSLELWTCNADGSAPLRMTSFGGAFVSGPRWSPDGRTLAFTATPDGWSAVFLLEVEGGVPRRVTLGEHNDIAAGFSRDGRWLYLASDRSGAWQIWRARADGSDPVQLTRDGGIAVQEAPDGSLLIARPDQPGLFRLAADGSATAAFAGVARGDWGNWVAGEGGITFIDRSGLHPVISFADLETGRLEAIAEIPNIASPSLAVSPDGRSILYSRVERTESDLMLVEGFR